MDNFKAVYKILSTLEKAMDLPAFDINLISAQKLEVSQERWCRYMLNDAPFWAGHSRTMSVLIGISLRRRERRKLL